MSEMALKKAARVYLPPGTDFGHRILMMLMADRADDRGVFYADHEGMITELTAESNAVMERLRGDFYVRVGVDMARVSRVVKAWLEVIDEQ